MNLISNYLGAAAIAMTGLALPAEDFRPLMKVAQATWPEKQHIGVICDYRTNASLVWDLAVAAGEGARITVVDARLPEYASVSAHLLANRKADYVVLMPKDRNFRDGSFAATIALNRLAAQGIPAIGTSARALKQGAVFSMGDGTDGQLLVTDRLIGTVDVLLPDHVKFSQKSSLVLTPKGMATISVHAAK